jgi:hypothetical protein
MRRVKTILALACLLMLALPAVTQQSEPVDLDAIYKIKEEGLQRSQVMNIASYLTDVYGGRVTGTPQYKAAGEWVKQKLTEWGVANVRLEPWTPAFGRGWSNERFSAHVVAPSAYPLIAYPMGWTPGTEGTVTGEAVLAVIENDADIEKFRGKLRGKFVLIGPTHDVLPNFDPPARRYTDEELAERARQPIPGALRAPAAGPFGPAQPPMTPADFQARQAFQRKRAQFYVDEGVLALLEPSRGDLGTVFVGGGGGRTPSDPPTVPRVAVAIEHYGRIIRTLEKKVPVTIEMNIQNKFYDDPSMVFNVIGEIPGTDKADEVVMLGGHFDSWHGGTGATDNAAGSAVMMEVMRILKTTGLKLRRTVRIGLWGAEEQGLLGSRAYVKENFADPQTMQLKPAHAKFQAYFNIDNGTGRIRGIYVQGNEAIAPIFARWMEPFHNMGMTTLSIRNTGGTDHQSFDGVGLPGFQFIQDPMDYGTRTHHSNMDVYERLQPDDLRQIAVVVASFVYHAANRDQLLPRKPLPKPRPAGPGGPAGRPPTD